MGYYKITDGQKELLRKLVAEYKIVRSVEFFLFPTSRGTSIQFDPDHPVVCQEGDLKELSVGGYVNYSPIERKGTITQEGIEAADSNFAPAMPPAASQTQHFYHSQYIQITGQGNSASMHVNTGFSTSDALQLVSSCRDRLCEINEVSRQIAEAYINAMEAELRSSKPNPSRLEACLKSIASFVDAGTKFAAKIEELAKFIGIDRSSFEHAFETVKHAIEKP